MNTPMVLQSGRSGDYVYYVRNGKQFRRRYVRTEGNKGNEA